MTVGTRSLLFGVHQIFLHPLFVALAWKDVYGRFPRDPRIWIAFIVHDWGYFGCPNMDGHKGKLHPLLGARIISFLFDPPRTRRFHLFKDKSGRQIGFVRVGQWGEFCLFHSRSLAKMQSRNPSALCAPDKLAFCKYPRWLYLVLARFSGELREYMHNASSPEGKKAGIDASSPERWFETLSTHMREVVHQTRKGQDCLSY